MQGDDCVGSLPDNQRDPNADSSSPHPSTEEGTCSSLALIQLALVIIGDASPNANYLTQPHSYTKYPGDDDRHISPNSSQSAGGVVSGFERGERNSCRFWFPATYILYTKQRAHRGLRARYFLRPFR